MTPHRFQVVQAEVVSQDLPPHALHVRLELLERRAHQSCGVHPDVLLAMSAAAILRLLMVHAGKPVRLTCLSDVELYGIFSWKRGPDAAHDPSQGRQSTEPVRFCDDHCDVAAHL